MIALLRTMLIAAALVPLTALAGADGDAPDAPPNGDPREWIREEFERAMTRFVDTEEFAIICERSEDGLELQKVQHRFLTAGYIRAWREYQDYATYLVGPGTGRVSIISTGNWYWEMEGWLRGCGDAYAMSRFMEKAIMTILASHLGEIPSFNTLEDSRVRFTPVRGV